MDSVRLLHFAKPFFIPFTSHPSAPQTSNFLVEVSCFHHPNILLAALVSQLRFLLTNFRRQSNVFQFLFIKRIADRVTYFIFRSMTLEHKEYSPVAWIGPYHRTIGCWSWCPFSPTPCFRRISLCRLSRTVVGLFWFCLFWVCGGGTSLPSAVECEYDQSNTVAEVSESCDRSLQRSWHSYLLAWISWIPSVHQLFRACVCTFSFTYCFPPS